MRSSICEGNMKLRKGGGQLQVKRERERDMYKYRDVNAKRKKCFIRDRYYCWVN